MSRKLFAGPWIGEFGCELMLWQGHLRYLAKSKGCEITVASRPDREYLYADFCHEFVPYRSGQLTSKHKCYDTEVMPIWERYPHLERLTCKQFPLTKQGGVSVVSNQEFIQYGTEMPVKQLDLLIHARATHKCDSAYRNWSLDNWTEFVERVSVDRLASIGTRDSAWHVPGTQDIRDLELNDLCSFIRDAGLVMGPSSGPMHLASLCGVKHIVWGGPRNRDRYCDHWNPLKTDLTFIDLWQPTVDRVLSACDVHEGPERDPKFIEAMAVSMHEAMAVERRHLTDVRRHRDEHMRRLNRIWKQVNWE